MASVTYEIHGFSADGKAIKTANFVSEYGPVSEPLAYDVALHFSEEWDAAKVELYRLEHVTTVLGPNFVHPEPEAFTADDDIPF